MSRSFRIGDLRPAERTAAGLPFATEWTPQEWSTWRARRTADPRNHGFPSVPPYEHHTLDEDFAHRARNRRTVRPLVDEDDQLIEPALVAMSVPVRDPRTGRTAGVAGVVSHTSRHTAQDLCDTLLPRPEEIRYTARSSPPRVMSVDITVGTRLPAYATALGRILLTNAEAPPLSFADLHP
ncbi:IclR family transcriptional regulator domain-containing protein [Streptomyces griseoloalbus]|uniref:IclR family transcriptional regulator domain-containing protein n=1 Tax=Streptomyces griseoloalbus TaxID=67303 RepID=UPI003F54258B